MQAETEPAPLEVVHPTFWDDVSTYWSQICLEKKPTAEPTPVNWNGIPKTSQVDVEVKGLKQSVDPNPFGGILPDDGRWHPQKDIGMGCFRSSIFYKMQPCILFSTLCVALFM